MNQDVNILLVEDNEGDILLTLEALREAKVTNMVSVVKDGQEALRYLRKEGPFKDVSTPDIVLLDINLPKIDGKEVLSVIKNNERLKTIPVVMLTTSDSEIDICESYQSHANCYITKPVDFNKFMDVIHIIRDFWINIVQLPKTSKAS